MAHEVEPMSEKGQRAQSRLLETLQRLLAIEATDLKGALEQAAQPVADALGAEKIDALLPDSSGESLVAVGVSDTPMGRRQRALGLDRQPLAEGGRFVEVYLSGTPFSTGHSEQDPVELPGIVWDLGVRSTLAVPFTVGDGRRGVLGAASPRPDAFAPDDLPFLEAVARWVGIVAHRAELVERAAATAEQARRAAVEGERERLQDRLAFTQTVMDTLEDGVYALDRDGRVTFMNPAAQGLLGWRLDELRGRDMHQMIHGRCADGTPLAEEDCPLLGVMRSHVAVRRDEDVFTRRDGSTFPVSYTSAPILAGAGKVEAIGAVIAFQDRTTRQRLEEERAELLARERAARDEAEVALRLRNDFLGVAAHDLRSPLTNIIGRAQLMRSRLRRSQEVDGGWLDSQLESVADTSRRMVALVNEFGDVARLQTGQALELQIEEVDLGALARAAADEALPPTDATDATGATGSGSGSGSARVLVDAPETPLEVEGDGARLGRVLQNIIGNAVKYSPEGTPVRVTLREAGGWAIIVVRDEGIGIPADELPRVFTRFYRASTARGIAGSGIGLSGAKAIVEQHGGHIALESDAGTGTAVTVRLPLSTPRQAGA